MYFLAVSNFIVNNDFYNSATSSEWAFSSLDLDVISFPLTSIEIDAEVRGGLGGGLGGGQGGGTFGGVGGVALLPVE
jgi:hypothetical protein